MSQGLSLRALAKELGLAAHGTLVDYEHGRRIPPEDLVIGCERVFHISDGSLRNLRDKALAERANHQADQLLADPQPAIGAAEPAPDDDVPPPPAPPRHRLWLWRHRRVVLAFAGFITAVAVGIGIAVWPQGATATRTTGSRPASATSALGGHSLLTHWGICWGGQAGSVQPTDVVTYQGSGTLQITVNKPSTAGFFATCTSHGLTTLHSGMKVTVYLRTPAAGPAVGGVNFWVYDSASNAVHAPETPKGVYEPLPATSGWEKYTWTVPAVDTVHSAGIEIDSTTDRPLIVWMSSFTW